MIDPRTKIYLSPWIDHYKNAHIIVAFLEDRYYYILMTVVHLMVTILLYYIGTF